MSSLTNDDRVIRFLGNNEITVLASGDETGGAYCVMELTTQPRGGATVLHTDRWVETFHVIEGQVEWTVERDGQLVTWVAERGETIVVPQGRLEDQARRKIENRSPLLSREHVHGGHASRCAGRFLSKIAIRMITNAASRST